MHLILKKIFLTSLGRSWASEKFFKENLRPIWALDIF